MADLWPKKYVQIWHTHLVLAITWSNIDIFNENYVIRFVIFCTFFDPYTPIGFKYKQPFLRNRL